MIRSLIITLLVFTLSSCMTLGPDYLKPKPAMPDSWTREIIADQKSAINGSQLWWKQFKDPTLNTLIEHARIANPNIYVARKRITESWHQRGVLKGALYPKLDIEARSDRGILDYDNNKVNVDIGSSHGDLAQLQYGWELDVFGKIKRSVEASEAEYEAKIEGWRDAQVFITAEVALTYIALRVMEERIEVAKDGVKDYLRTKNQITERLDLGVASQLEMEEITGRYHWSESQIPRLKEEYEILRNRISQLTTIEPGHLPKILAKNSGIPTPPGKIITGFPADLIRSRPDIRRAERKMAAQTARIGVAEAEAYPEFSLSGALTYELITQGITTVLLDRVMGIGANLKWKLFRACSHEHRIKENEALLEQLIGEYQKVVIQAVIDVENVMSRLHYTKQRAGILKKSRVAQKKSAELMGEAYITGEVSLRRLLNAQQDYITVRDEEIATIGRNAAHSVRLFKALGGGELAGVPEQEK